MAILWIYVIGLKIKYSRPLVHYPRMSLISQKRSRRSWNQKKSLIMTCQNYMEHGQIFVMFSPKEKLGLPHK